MWMQTVLVLVKLPQSAWRMKVSASNLFASSGLPSATTLAASCATAAPAILPQYLLLHCHSYRRAHQESTPVLVLAIASQNDHCGKKTAPANLLASLAQPLATLSCSAVAMVAPLILQSCCEKSQSAAAKAEAARVAATTTTTATAMATKNAAAVAAK